MGVTAIDDNITLLEIWLKLMDEVIYSRSGLDEKDDLAGPLELRDQLLDGMGTLNVCACEELIRSLTS